MRDVASSFLLKASSNRTNTSCLLAPDWLAACADTDGLRGAPSFPSFPSIICSSRWKEAPRSSCPSMSQ
ncbi:unnamed protein product [Pleuronectes platessa]|uniref:Uncharacterized protein n=1 Tax=Pleuronectes platessa TaxID=8262 RepID=A0A9N7ZBD4_PLEPL|nr:unnamed protein product [Pleuronectes platessa]